MKTYTVAVLGATGAVGQEMIKILQERNFPVGKLIPLASARSAGKTLKFKGEDQWLAAISGMERIFASPIIIESH